MRTDRALIKSFCLNGDVNIHKVFVDVDGALTATANELRNPDILGVYVYRIPLTEEETMVSKLTDKEIKEAQRESAKAAFRELMTQFSEARERWLNAYGSVHGFNEWFTKQVIGTPDAN